MIVASGPNASPSSLVSSWAWIVSGVTVRQRKPSSAKPVSSAEVEAGVICTIWLGTATDSATARLTVLARAPMMTCTPSDWTSFVAASTPGAESV